MKHLVSKEEMKISSQLRRENDWRGFSVHHWLCGYIVNVLFDCVGGEAFLESLYYLDVGGRVISVGTPAPKNLDLNNLPRYSEITEAVQAQGLFFILKESGEQVEELLKLVEEGLQTSVGPRVPFTQEAVREAWTRAEKGGISGTVVVKVREWSWESF